MITINTDNPINIAIVSLFISLVICIGIIYLSKPHWVYCTTKDGERKLCWYLILSTSLTISSMFAIITILFFASKKEGPNGPNYNYGQT